MVCPKILYIFLLYKIYTIKKYIKLKFTQTWKVHYGNLIACEDISNVCNFMLGLPYYKSEVYVNRHLRLVVFYICGNGSVANQHDIVQFSVPMSNARILIGSVCHETSGVSVDISCTSGGKLISSHSKNVSISHPRYSGLVAY